MPQLEHFPLAPEKLDQESRDQSGLEDDDADGRDDQRLMLLPQCGRIHEKPHRQIGGGAFLGAAGAASETKRQRYRRDSQRRQTKGLRHDLDLNQSGSLAYDRWASNGRPATR